MLEQVPHPRGQPIQLGGPGGVTKQLFALHIKRSIFLLDNHVFTCPRAGLLSHHQHLNEVHQPVHPKSKEDSHHLTSPVQHWALRSNASVPHENIKTVVTAEASPQLKILFPQNKSFNINNNWCRKSALSFTPLYQ